MHKQRAPAVGGAALVPLLVAVLLAVAVLGSLALTAARQGGPDRAVRGVTTSGVRWEWTGGAWKAYGQPPSCPRPLLLRTPVDLARVTSILYPGQTRGGDYKAHGGFADDNASATTFTVRAPLDAAVANASRYLEGGKVQYLFTFQNACGIRYRFDHLATLSPTLARITATLPAAREGDSRTTSVQPPVSVTAGEVLATAVGLPGNVFVDFGVYDLRQKNAVSRNPAWARTHNAEQGHYGVCWFDLLPAGDAARVKALPARGGARQSDYCR